MFVSALLGMLAQPQPAAASETREEYLARLRNVCELGCQEPRDLLRTARKRGRSAEDEMAGILDIFAISRFEDRIRLHASPLFDTLIPDAPAYNGEPLPFSRSDIVVEMDVPMMLQLIALATPEPPTANERASEPNVLDDTTASADEIIVERDRVPRLLLPSLVTLRSLVANRRVVVRGRPVLTPVLVGARLDRRRSQLTLVIDSIDDLVLLPRYDEAGNPILDGPLQGLREDY